MHTVRWGIIGAGNVCEHKSGPPLYKLPNSSLELVHRRDPRAGMDFVRRHGHGRYVDNLDDLVNSDQIDAVYVASPHEWHAKHTLISLDAGKPVLVEKPMATSPTDCHEMLNRSREMRIPLGVAYYRRGYPGIQKLRELIDEQAIGRIEKAAFNNQFPTSHRIDLVYFLFGEITAIKLQPGKQNPFRFESTIEKCSLRTESGTEVSMMTGWNESGMPESVSVYGEKGNLHLFDLKKGFLCVETERDKNWIQCGSLPYTHWGLIENFNHHLLHQEPLLCSAEEGLKSNQVLHHLDCINEENIWITLPAG